MNPVISCTNPAAYCEPQTSLITDNATTRHMFVKTAIGTVDKNKTTRLTVPLLNMYAKILPRAVNEMSDLRPLQTSSTTTYESLIRIMLPFLIAGIPILFITISASCAANIFRRKLIFDMTAIGRGTMKNRNISGNNTFLNILPPKK